MAWRGMAGMAGQGEDGQGEAGTATAGLNFCSSINNGNSSMKTSESLAKIAPALLKAQSAIKFAVKDAKNPHFKSTYADLPSVIDAVKPALNGAGIVFVQTFSPSDSGCIAVTTRLLHESGEWIEDTATIPMQKMDPQGYGSSATYGRRYALAAITGLYQDDDDGNAASLAREPEPQPTAVKGAKESLQKCVTLAALREAWDLLPPNLQKLCKATKDTQKSRIESEALTGA